MWIRRLVGTVGVLLFAVLTLPSTPAAAQAPPVMRIPRVSLSITQVQVNPSGQVSVSGLQDCSAAVSALVRSGVLPANTALVVANVSYFAYQRTRSALTSATYQSGRGNACWANTPEPPGVTERCVAQPDGTYHPCRWTTAVYFESDDSWADPGFIDGTAPFGLGSVHVSATLEAGWYLAEGVPEPQQFSPPLAASASRALMAVPPVG